MTGAVSDHRAASERKHQDSVYTRKILTSPSILSPFFVCVGESNRDGGGDAVVGVEVRNVEAPQETPISTYGTINCGAELMRDAWTNLKQVFSIRKDKDHISQRWAGTKVFHYGDRYSSKFLQKLTVDLLVVDQGAEVIPPKDYQKEDWFRLVEGTPDNRRPLVMTEVWPSNAQLWQHGPMCKTWIRRWGDLGYRSRCKLVRAVSVGSAFRQNRLVVVRTSKQIPESSWIWDRYEPCPQEIRPMANLLTPPGLTKRSSYLQHYAGRAPRADRDPMPGSVGAVIETERGFRRLSLEETGRGLGITKEDTTVLTPSLLKRTTNLFLWEYLSFSISRIGRHDGYDGDRDNPAVRSGEPVTDTTKSEAYEPAFEWRTPNLEPDGPWHRQRIQNLKYAATFFDDPDEVVDDGLKRLARHRNNYNEDGPDPDKLQLLWWEFPSQHWMELKEGARQNFLVQPRPELTPNAPMNDSMRAAAAEFVDELIDLGVTDQIDEGQRILSNAPLFVVPKPGQEGQWRVIGDALRGGQNSCVGQDPVFLPRIAHILDSMYEGGYSAVIDLSKFFYNFPTHREDRPYLGLIHPVTQVLLTYYGLMMGAGNSPAIACRMGLAFVRLLREKFSVFQGKAKANCWWTNFTYSGYDPSLGYGYVLEGKDGGAVLIWVWVDDFLIHGPTYEKTCEAVRFFLDTAVDCGFLFHPKKCVWPCQEVTYHGFVFDTRTIPCLRIPVAKRERGLAMVEHLLDSAPHKQWSRLSMAVVSGTLESLVEATPRRLGHTHLRAFHSLIHPAGLGEGAEPYYTYTSITNEVRDGLKWWSAFFVSGEGRYSRPTRAATFAPTFGDGSGTGTGGTFRLPETPRLQMWKGKWQVAVLQFTSNWKELRTLYETLLRIRDSPDRESVRNTTVFYFTDSSSVYWIAAKGSSRWAHLHSLIVAIRLLEVELGCILQVVHIPGLAMIIQGTDGLSRGVWISALHKSLPEDRLLQSIFDPVTFDPTLVWEVLPHTSQSFNHWQYYDWNQEWFAPHCMDTLTVWCPPPELARQALTFILETWCERPYTTSALFFVPRVVPSFWWGLSRYLIELPVIRPHTRKMRFPPLLPIPITVLYLPPHTLQLPPPPRLDSAPDTPLIRRHRQQAERMRRLPPRHIDEGPGT